MYQIGTTLLDPAIMGEVIEDESYSRVVREAQTGVKGETEVRIDLNASMRLRLSGQAPLVAIVTGGYAWNASRTDNAYAVLAALRNYTTSQQVTYNGFDLGRWHVTAVGYRVRSSAVLGVGPTYTVARWIDWRLAILREKAPQTETAVPIPPVAAGLNPGIIAIAP